MTEDYQWEHYHMQETGVAAGFRLARYNPHRVLGFLKKGSKKRQGWHVHKYLIADPVARLPHTMPLDQAQDAAKLILLSLKENT